MSLVIYEGPSLLDGRTSVSVCLTGISNNSNNVKTGNMVQAWILVTETDPVDAIKGGIDKAICGTCPMRGDGFRGRACYVQMRAPQRIWRSSHCRSTPSAAAKLVARRTVRLGAYGDPAAVPYEVWEQLLVKAIGWTGYTHQWRTCDQRLKQFCMASVEAEGEAALAQAMGWRTYRITQPGAPALEREVLCPASNEAGRKLTCAQCLYCSGGNLRGSVYIPVHGAAGMKNAFLRKVAAPLSTIAESHSHDRSSVAVQRGQSPALVSP